MTIWPSKASLRHVFVFTCHMLSARFLRHMIGSKSFKVFNSRPVIGRQGCQSVTRRCQALRCTEQSDGETASSTQHLWPNRTVFCAVAENIVFLRGHANEPIAHGSSRDIVRTDAGGFELG